jgi:hypothetical protein
MSYKKVYLIMVLIVALAFTTLLKCSHISLTKIKMEWYAIYLVCEQDQAGNKVESDDNEIIAAKIFPKSTFQYTINPFVWTRKQMSTNDDLLQACLDAKERDDIKDALEYEAAAKTFDARFSEWELNLEKAKESLK